MKNVLLFLILVCSFNLISAQSSEEAAVKQALTYYMEGGTNGDFETLKKAFHETATMKYIREGYKEVNALEFFGSRMSGKKSDRDCRITYLDVSGPAAHARIELEYEDFMFVDYMNLLKVDGEWKIVSKIFDRVNK